MGSIFYNAPDNMCDDRCREFRKHVGPQDRLIIGQDGPDDKQEAKTQASYQTQTYHKFFNSYLEGIQRYAGIEAGVNSPCEVVGPESVHNLNPETTWNVESKMDRSMHFFEVTANIRMRCTKLGNLTFDAGTKYIMFPSWKRGEKEVHEITEKQGLAIRTFGKSPTSGMRQFIVQLPPSY